MNRLNSLALPSDACQGCPLSEPSLAAGVLAIALVANGLFDEIERAGGQALDKRHGLRGAEAMVQWTPC